MTNEIILRKENKKKGKLLYKNKGLLAIQDYKCIDVCMCCNIIAIENGITKYCSNSSYFILLLLEKNEHLLPFLSKPCGQIIRQAGWFHSLQLIFSHLSTRYCEVGSRLGQLIHLKFTHMCMLFLLRNCPHHNDCIMCMFISILSFYM